jgi:prepilin-type N-terminal cleavage/methylation domain-containing protein
MNLHFHLPPLARARGRAAFTLIELLIVIGIMALLASLIFPVTKAVNRNKLRSKARAELAAVEFAIDAYKAKLGFFPPDNPRNPLLNQLYFELSGTTNTGRFYQTIDGSCRVDVGQVGNYFPGVSGFLNCSQDVGGDEGRTAGRFLKELRPGQYGDLVTNATDRVRVLLCSVPWPNNPTFPIANHPGMNPFRYNSSSPTNNPTSYDLWVDVIIDGKTNRISNWSKEPLIVSVPW